MLENEVLSKDLSDITLEEFEQLSFDAKKKLQSKFRDIFRRSIHRYLEENSEIQGVGYIGGKPVITSDNYNKFVLGHYENEIEKLEKEHGKPCFLVTRGKPIEEN